MYRNVNTRCKTLQMCRSSVRLTLLARVSRDLLSDPGSTIYPISHWLHRGPMRSALVIELLTCPPKQNPFPVRP